jgi:hypothetical protein
MKKVRNARHDTKRRKHGRGLTGDEFRRERRYQATLALTRLMYLQGVITASDLLIIDSIMLAQYRPLLGSLYSVSERMM